jgi:hypothetical protein
MRGFWVRVPARSQLQAMILHGICILHKILLFFWIVARVNEDEREIGIEGKTRWRWRAIDEISITLNAKLRSSSCLLDRIRYLFADESGLSIKL